MIATSRAVAMASLAVAASLHIAAMVLEQGEDEVQIEGGAPTMSAAFGNSFADMVAGAAPSVTPSEVTPEEQPDPAETPPREHAEQVETLKTVSETRPEPVRQTQPDETLPPAPEVTHEAQKPQVRRIEAAQPTKTAQVQTQGSAAVAPSAAATPQQVAETAQAPAPPAPAVPTEAPARPVAAHPVSAAPGQELARATSPSETTPVEVQPEPAITAPDEDQRPTTPSTSLRPAARPEYIEAKAAPPKPKREKPAKQPPKQPKSPAGNSDKNTKKGSETAKTKTGGATSSSSAATSKAAGNAAISSYKGKVFRKIARAKSGKVNISGAVLVSLTIGGNGQLTGVRVARSSGSARLDKIAVSQVRRAAPFPRPPDGRTHSFSVRIRGGG